MRGYIVNDGAVPGGVLSAATTACRKCGVALRPGVFIAQTVNRLRPGQEVGTLYPCGPGVLAECAKCPACGWSCTTAAPAEAYAKTAV